MVPPKAIKKPHVCRRHSGIENPELRTRSRPGNKLIFIVRLCGVDPKQQRAERVATIQSKQAGIPSQLTGNECCYLGRPVHAGAAVNWHSPIRLPL